MDDASRLVACFRRRNNAGGTQKATTTAVTSVGKLSGKHFSSMVTNGLWRCNCHFAQLPAARTLTRYLPSSSQIALRWRSCSGLSEARPARAKRSTFSIRDPKRRRRGMIAF